MGKSKPPKKDSQVPQKHLHSRLSYLHQAATYLATVGSHNGQQKATKSAECTWSVADRDLTNQGSVEATRLLMHLRGVSRKSQIRIAPRVKHSICKCCDVLLIPGETMTEKLANPSKGGRKSWADVYEIHCDKCGTIKRFPCRRKSNQTGREEAKPVAEA
ncbi:uncharacterized protein PV07_07036 [Cladophialophora immunda]|uniref:Rpr2-domain-containing protein n=1 Tax=Cladophialophora immunda TaxID=569365 RepID=A0A0D2C813_9EURO|nr:uncharacterized protein PV07_07036 [Cladophialophora immunda]KIW27283.1 hypothetical protein PV07_07036 [Cladophialophora immunda]OQV05866.1 RNAse P Rpr2/Rpp21/SNM1 subunit domain-containing protein [Cladophialophora immunda]